MNNSFLPALLTTTTIAFAASVIPAQAFELGFTNKTNNGSINVGSQFTTTVDDIGSGKVKFTFSNPGPTDATITQINFGKTNFLNLLSFSSLSSTNPHDSDLGVNFSKATNPTNLPAIFGWNPAITFDAKNPSGYQKYGVDKGESLSIIFNLASGKTFSDIETGFKTGTLAIATHVQSIGGSSGFSDKFESTYNTKSVPEPSTILGLAAFGMSGLLIRKKRKNANAEKVTA
ncbi:MAG: PEP-CTERM sorting domain-containing protein [Aulosira sp. ZfuVER01]|nr:PEP-CTERM sorting domain-containing protein [Aulosira sp. ZfuVER01]MDZ7998739.1 PEP-CTERM sorting domain-containing protein [Aulosira sp. DedVER01a]MDZ8053915.1 PEP-CTERM sorting domain-containing protein [Aulosira sp. ZfuCHP01]